MHLFGAFELTRTCFFITVFEYSVNLFYSFRCLSFPFLKGMQTREGVHCALSVFPFIYYYHYDDDDDDDYPFLNILSICFILFIAFLFLFLRDSDSRKGTLCPFCVPIHKKKNVSKSSKAPKRSLARKLENQKSRKS